MRIGIVAAGGMGSALAERIVSASGEVLTSLAGRSRSSAERAVAAGMRDVGDEGLADAAVLLSVVPPDQALNLAERLSRAMACASTTPIYVDCNAVSPELARSIERVVTDAGIRFVDGGIIGLPPRQGTPGPTIFLSGADAGAVSEIIEPLGVRTHVLALPNGAASALKMSYAGITKGLIAIAATMALAAEQTGVGDALAAELARSQPGLFAGFTKSIPDMLPKARRWVPEMKEIQRFIGSGISSEAAYGAFAAFYEQVADKGELHETLKEFYKAPATSKQV